MPHERTNLNRRPEEQGHEPDAIWARTVASLGIGLLALVIISMACLAWTLHALFPEPPLTDAGVEWRLQQRAPGVQPNQAYDQQRMLAEEQAYLKEFAWEDKDRGIARIPIQRGIEVMARRELKVEWPSPTETASKKESK